MNQSEEGQPVGGFELVPVARPVPVVILGETSQPVAPSTRLVVTDVATEFRVEKENPLGEACRLIVALTVTFQSPRQNLSRLFRRYYVYEATDFTPERLASTLRDMATDIQTAAGEIRSGAPCRFDARPVAGNKKTG